MKILFLLPRFHTNIFHAVKALQDRGHKVRMLCARQNAIEDHSHIVPDVIDQSRLNWRFVFTLLRQSRPDLIVIREPKGRWRRFNLAAALLGIKCLGYDPSPYTKRRSLMRKLREYWQGRPMRRWTPVYGYGAMADRQAYYVPFPIEAGGAERSYAPDGQARIICVGKLSQPRKRHLFLLDVLESLPVDRFSLTLVGSSSKATDSTDDYADQLRKRVAQSPLSDQIEILENLPFSEMTALYAAHDICVMPADREVVGIAPVEAMAQGCVPVISTGCGSGSLLTNGENGYLFPVDDAEVLKAILAKLIGDQALLVKVGRAAQAFVADELNGQQFADRFEHIAAQL